ncbi:MAG: acetate kinase [Bacteroidales bacterium]|jgi:acetate kinase|nr:acetate kinase [Bacteroidales bacterium]
MKILVLNCGSSSIKYQLIDMENNAEVMAKGLVERIGLDMGEFTHRAKDKEKYYLQTPVPNHEEGINRILQMLTDKTYGVITDISEIGACGHRVAHGGEYFSQSAVIGDQELEWIEQLCAIAPLHNPGSLMGLRVMKRLLPKVKQVGVFDTSFHQTMQPHAYLYAIPYEYYTNMKIRRYGFHGTSHKYVAPKAANMLGEDWTQKKIIVCHLGNGASICAVDCGKSVDTSMGFTPVEGLIMGTRSGDLDLGVLMYIAEKENLNYKSMSDLVNKKSGLQGISGGKSDMRDIRAGKDAGDERCRYAFDMFAYRVKKYIGAYIAAMNGVDIIAMTGGIGENAWFMREAIFENMDFLGVELDPVANERFAGEDGIISKQGSKVKVLSVTTNEELVIAQDTYNLAVSDAK